MAGGTANQPAGRYPTSMWTQVIDVIQKDDGEWAWAALSEFCQSYRPAILRFFRRHSSSPEQAFRPVGYCAARTSPRSSCSRTGCNPKRGR